MTGPRRDGRRRAGRRRAADAGFTLVEALVAVALLGLLGGLLAAGFRTVSDAWQRTATRREALRDGAAALAPLRALLADARPALVAGRGGGRAAAFDGSADRVAFLAPLPRRFGASPVVAYELRADGGALRLGWRAGFAAGGADVAGQFAPTETILLKDILQVEIAYYGAAAGDPDGPRWHRSWKEQRALPSLIRLRLVRAAPPEAGRPAERAGTPAEMVVAPLATAAPCPSAPGGAECPD